MSRSIFTPEELAELAAFDAEIEDEDKPLTLEEYRESMRRDRGLEGPPKPHSEAQRAKEREYSRKRRSAPAVAEMQRQAHRAWYAKNCEYAKAWQREYYRTHSDAKRRSTEQLRERLKDNPEAAELRALRKALGMSMRQLGPIFGKSYQVIHYWETGKTRVPPWALERLRELAEPQEASGPSEPVSLPPALSLSRLRQQLPPGGSPNPSTEAGEEQRPIVAQSNINTGEGPRQQKGGEGSLLIYIRERRAALGVTQEGLAARVGVERPAITLWETGARTPTTDKLPALASALGCSIDDLFRPPEENADREEAG